MKLNIKKFIGLALFAVSLFGVLFIWLSWPVAKQKYISWRFNRNLHGFVNSLEAAKKADYAAAMADTYGGKTPQETLQMYIDAVEKGDYELASKYFIGDKQEEELASFQSGTEANKQKYINILKILDEGKLSDDGQRYNMRAKIDGPDYFASFKKYPNGIWKIVEI